jgi:hypothetical protein
MKKLRKISKSEIVDRAKNAGITVNECWQKLRKLIRRKPSLKKRIEELERNFAGQGDSITKILRWIEDHENRLALLEHFHGYDLAEVLCSACGSPMRVRKNQKTGQFFLGCVNYKANSVTGKSKCPGRDISNYDLQKLLRKYREAA